MTAAIQGHGFPRVIGVLTHLECMQVFTTASHPSPQVHGFPRVIGVLTHLDSFRNAATLRRVKKQVRLIARDRSSLDCP